MDVALVAAQLGLRPVDARPCVGVEALAALEERAADDLLGPGELARVGEGIAEQAPEADRLDPVSEPLEGDEAALEDRDARVELADERVRAAEALGERGSLPLLGARGDERALEVGDRLARFALAQREVAEPFLHLRPLRGGERAVEELAVERAGALEVVEPERDLGLEDREADRTDVRAGREVVLADAEPAAELP